MTDATETVDEFRHRARAWLAEAMPPLGAQLRRNEMDGHYARGRELQRMIWDGGFAGICFPADYGGLGLDVEYQQAFTEESSPYEMPWLFNVPTLGILAATLIDLGSHEQKLRHLPAILRGEELGVQFLSEPTGGSDLAGSLTRADRDGDVWIMNGSKIWSSAAYASDYAMCLARTNWDVPKHRGLTMFIVKIHQPNIQVDQIRQVDGSMEFCQEFFDDVVIPTNQVIGDVDDGWTVALRLLLHERTAVGGGSPYTSGRSVGGHDGDHDQVMVRLARAAGRAGDTVARQLVAEAQVELMVAGHLVHRVGEGAVSGGLAPTAGALMKLFGAVMGVRRSEIMLELAGAESVDWAADDEDGDSLANTFLARQGFCLGGGSNEIQRNIISERVLGMPREWAADHDIPYRDVRSNTMPTSPR